MISKKKYNEIVAYAHRRLGRYPHLDPFDIAHECIMHPDFTDEEEVWRKIFKTAMYRALDMTNLEVAIEATQVRHIQSQIEETFECSECGELVPDSQWSPAKSICRRCYSKAYYEANREKLKASSRAYYEANREKLKAYWKAYYETNKKERKAYAKTYMKSYREASREKLKASSRAYYEANREKIKAYSRAYYEANREKIKAYWKAYREAKKKEAETPKKQTNATKTPNPSYEIQNHPRQREN